MNLHLDRGSAGLFVLIAGPSLLLVPFARMSLWIALVLAVAGPLAAVLFRALGPEGGQSVTPFLGLLSVTPLVLLTPPSVLTELLAGTLGVAFLASLVAVDPPRVARRRLGASLLFPGLSVGVATLAAVAFVPSAQSVGFAATLLVVVILAVAWLTQRPGRFHTTQAPTS